MVTRAIQPYDINLEETNNRTRNELMAVIGQTTEEYDHRERLPGPTSLGKPKIKQGLMDGSLTDNGWVREGRLCLRYGM